MKKLFIIITLCFTIFTLNSCEKEPLTMDSEIYMNEDSTDLPDENIEVTQAAVARHSIIEDAREGNNDELEILSDRDIIIGKGKNKNPKNPKNPKKPKQEDNPSPNE